MNELFAIREGIDRLWEHLQKMDLSERKKALRTGVRFHVGKDGILWLKEVDVQIYGKGLAGFFVSDRPAFQNRKWVPKGPREGLPDLPSLKEVLDTILVERVLGS